MTTFPINPALSLKVADIAIQLQHITQQSIMADAIREGAATKPKESILMIYEQMTSGNEDAIANVIGWRLTDKIKSLFI